MLSIWWLKNDARPERLRSFPIHEQLLENNEISYSKLQRKLLLHFFSTHMQQVLSIKTTQSELVRILFVNIRRPLREKRKICWQHIVIVCCARLREENKKKKEENCQVSSMEQNVSRLNEYSGWRTHTIKNEKKYNRNVVTVCLWGRKCTSTVCKFCW